MRRRAFSSLLAAVVVGTAGCLQLPGTGAKVPLDVLLCNFTSDSASGEITIIRPADEEPVLSDSFSFAGRASDGATGTASGLCTEYANSVSGKGRYRFDVALESSESEAFVWTFDGSDGLQIELRSTGIRFRELENPSP